MKNGLDIDRKGVAVVVGCALFLFLLLGVLPHWLRQGAADDLRLAVRQTAPGIIVRPEINPVGEFKTDIFNAVVVSFAGRRAFFALPPQASWRPKAGDEVLVTYRTGTRSKLVHVDSVTFVKSPPAPRLSPTPPARK